MGRDSPPGPRALGSVVGSPPSRPGKDVGEGGPGGFSTPCRGFPSSRPGEGGGVGRF